MNAYNTSSTASGPPSTSRGRQGADSRGRRVACPAGKNVDNVFKDEMSKRISRAFAVTEGKVHIALPENCPYNEVGGLSGICGVVQSGGGTPPLRGGAWWEWKRDSSTTLRMTMRKGFEDEILTR